MRPTLEPSVRSDEIFPYYWNRTQNAFTPPQDIAVKPQILNPTDVAQAHSLADVFHKVAVKLRKAQRALAVQNDKFSDCARPRRNVRRYPKADIDQVTLIVR